MSCLVKRFINSVLHLRTACGLVEVSKRVSKVG